MTVITYIIVVPTEKAFTPFQGWYKEVAEHDFLTLLAAATLGPTDTSEIFMSHNELIENKRDGNSKVVRTINSQLIPSIPSLIKSSLAIILTPLKYASEVALLTFPTTISSIMATTGNSKGAVNLRTLNTRLSAHVFDYPIYKHIKNAQARQKIKTPIPKMRSVYSKLVDFTFHNAGCTIANELLHNALGYQSPTKKNIDPFDITHYYDAIANGAESLLDITSTTEHAVAEVIIYAPAIQSYFYNTNSNRWNQILRNIKRTHHRDFVKNGLIKNPEYSGFTFENYNGPEDHPAADPFAITIAGVRRKELKATNFSVALLASTLTAPVIRLPNSVNLQLSKLKDIENTQLKSDTKSVRQLQIKFKALSDEFRSAFSERFRHLITKRTNSCIICSDVPLEWAYLGNLPLMISHEVSRIPMTPGNMLLQFSSLGAPAALKVAELREILVIRSFSPDDEIADLLENTLKHFPLTNGTSVTFVDVNTVDEVVEALNNYTGGFVIFDCHGTHDGAEGIGWLKIGDEQLNSWTLHKKATLPPIVALSACSTAAISGSYVSVANGFLRAGALSVIGTFLPVDGLLSATFISRIIFRVDAFLTELQEKNYTHITWRLFISHTLRLSYATDVLTYFFKLDLISPNDYIHIHQEASHNISSFHEDWYEDLISNVSNRCGIAAHLLTQQIKEDTPLMETMYYCQLGRPDLLTIAL